MHPSQVGGCPAPAAAQEEASRASPHSKSPQGAACVVRVEGQAAGYWVPAGTQHTGASVKPRAQVKAPHGGNGSSASMRWWHYCTVLCCTACCTHRVYKRPSLRPADALTKHSCMSVRPAQGTVQVSSSHLQGKHSTAQHGAAWFTAQHSTTQRSAAPTYIHTGSNNRRSKAAAANSAKGCVPAQLRGSCLEASAGSAGAHSLSPPTALPQLPSLHSTLLQPTTHAQDDAKRVHVAGGRGLLALDHFRSLQRPAAQKPNGPTPVR